MKPAPPATKADAEGAEELNNVWQPGYDSLEPLELTWPARDCDRIARLRGVVSVRFPSASSAFEFGAATKEGDVRKDDAYEATVVTLPSPTAPTLRLRIKPSGTVEEFRRTPVELRVRFKEQSEESWYANGTIEDGVPTYAIGSYQESETLSLESIEVKIHRKTHERKIPFEFRDIPLK